MTLQIDLQDGFSKDEVIIRVNGKQVFKKAGVSTDARISRADGVEVATTAAEVSVEVEVPAKRLKASQKVKPATAPHVGISLRDGKLQLRAQADVFLYM